jgi:hypothetical protein
MTLDELNTGNFCMLTAGMSPLRLTMLNPPTRSTLWTPEEALVAAAWLVAMAEPFSSVKFAGILHKVQST